MNHPKSFSDAVELRQHAEQRLQNRVRLPVEEAETMSPELMQILIHELRVHQIELELQNEELRRTQAELDKTRSRYFDLYDLAPVGYCTLNEHGLILEGNLAACHLLGIARSSMPMTPFSRFVANEDQDEFYLHRHRLLTTGHPQTCELRLRRKDGTIVWVQLVSSVTQGTEVDFLYRTALTDITAIKTLESALRTSEEFHLSIFDSLSEHVAVLDENGIIIAVNEAWRRFSLDNGGSSQAIAPIGVNYLQMCGRAGTETGCANSAQLHRAMQAILDGHQSEFTLEYPCHTQNQKRWFHVQVTRMLGPRPGLVVSHLNVTNRKMAEMALEESRRELVLVANHVPGPVARIDRDLRYLFANNHYEKFFGKTLDQVIGHRMPDVLGADLFQRVETHVVSALAGEQVTFESTFPSSNGMVGHTLVNYVPDRDSDDNVIGFFVLAIDITERKQAEEARNAALKILQKVTNRVPGAVYQFRLRPDGHVSMPYSNEGLYPLLGISPDDVREDASEIFVNAHPEDIDGLMASIQQSAREITHWTHECRFLINGTQKWLAGNSTPEREPDGSILWHGFITDITERKAAEATRESLESQLRESQKMEAIGTLAGGIAHDFNNALAAILGNLELAQKEIPGNESLALYLGEIHRSGIRARNLVQQILSYCRQQPTELRRLSLAAAVQNTMAMLKATVPVRFSLQVTCADEPYWIIADGTQIEQVLINLVTNAVQACGSRSGTITVTVESLCADELQRTDACPPVSEQIQDSGSVVRLTVTDDGPGIAREIR
ncbi:MAG: PAS domain S-box protein, partial [Planctomyces sp.]